MCDSYYKRYEVIKKARIRISKMHSTGNPVELHAIIELPEKEIEDAIAKLKLRTTAFWKADEPSVSIKRKGRPNYCIFPANSRPKASGKHTTTSVVITRVTLQLEEKIKER